ncbi:hypothetical protein DPMN_193254 [Dreissena polymorpha]|uniref:Uncharacterized protein n=1 Tax=Dreissena polymorpha TaxID=45954 RepID=A0A9D3Y6Z1_DREPO|nr:hypothetical protein DPMN_193254 [Dreissena polymorpha]
MNIFFQVGYINTSNSGALQTLLANKTNIIEVNVDDNPYPLLAQIQQLAQEIQHGDVLSQSSTPSSRKAATLTLQTTEPW